MRAWFVQVVRRLGTVDLVLDTSANLTADAARKEAAAVLARIWAGDDMARTRVSIPK